MDNVKQYVLIDYDDNNRVIIIDSDKNKCLRAIEMILGNDIAIGAYEDCEQSIEEIMEDAAWVDFGFDILEYSGTSGVF
ncbi:hypothetical protein [Listeria seeligeri]|uniref:hypothetical protein n=1 Tax=Listeria seeligeri TaxID=1640 RepID=UPI001627717A|nr:hypothetical protein [Listeria seeligeri]MBC1746891.1 hypothetical protein [Listeria seeligeri]MBC2233030.1 hypothetical protein [Listeria seeligeri]MBF2626140.1 hypothetical protein [Listeria seeligeri]MBF2673466.1 hypothetical protein [Listeria seeligeri]